MSCTDSLDPLLTRRSIDKKIVLYTIGSNIIIISDNDIFIISSQCLIVALYALCNKYGIASKTTLLTNGF